MSDSGTDDVSESLEEPTGIYVAVEENLSDEDRGSVFISWADHSTSETGYELQYSEDFETWIELTTVSADGESYADSPVRGVTLYYRVRAVNSSGNSDWATSYSVDVPYLVSFDSRGGSAVVNQEVFEGGQASVPDEIEFSGYNISRWYKDSDLSTPYDFSEAVDHSLTLYGEWGLAANLSYEIEGGEVTITGYEGSDVSVTIPDYIEGYPVTTFADGYYDEDLGDLLSVFSGCDSLETVILPETLISLGSYTFYCCTSLKSINFPDSLTSYGPNAFFMCESLESISLPDTLTAIEDDAFFFCTGLVSVDLPEALTAVGDSAFSHCSKLESITFPDTLSSVGEWAFRECSSLTSVTFPEVLATITIDRDAFYDCTSLGSIILPAPLASVESHLFCGCSSLASATLPDTVTSIDKFTFSSCTNLTSFICLAVDPPALDASSVFDEDATDLTIYVPADSVEMYKAAENWSAYADVIEAIVTE